METLAQFWAEINILTLLVMPLLALDSRDVCDFDNFHSVAINLDAFD
jgi:hypothetical protein